MKTYRIKLKPAGNFVTPLQADTIFGHFCWIVKWREGEDSLRDFLNAFESEPPFILSDGFPGDLLPAPIHLPSLIHESDEREKFNQQKKIKKMKWLTFSEFKSIQEGHSIKPDGERSGFKTLESLHSSINRITGTTGDEGSLYELEEYVLGKPHHYISIYLKIQEGWEERVHALFRDLAVMGYGGKRSVGKGSFKLAGFEPFVGFEMRDDGNGFMSLSNFVPAKDDPANGYYQVFVKYGKVGGEFVTCEKPFKKPLLMLRVGSVFECDKMENYYGRMVKGLLPYKPEIVQYAYAFPVSMQL